MGTTGEKVGASEGFCKWVALGWDVEGDGWEDKRGFVQQQGL